MHMPTSLEGPALMPVTPPPTLESDQTVPAPTAGTVARHGLLERITGLAATGGADDSTFRPGALPDKPLTQLIAELDTRPPGDIDRQLRDSLAALGCELRPDDTAGRFLREMLERLPAYPGLATVGQRQWFKRSLGLALVRLLHGRVDLLDRLIGAIGGSAKPAEQLQQLQIFLPGDARGLCDAAASELRQGGEAAPVLRRLREHILDAWDPAGRGTGERLRLGSDFWYVPIGGGNALLSVLLASNFPGQQPQGVVLQAPDDGATGAEFVTYEFPKIRFGRWLHIAQADDRQCTLHAFNQLIAALGYKLGFMLSAQALSAEIQRLGGGDQTENFDTGLTTRAFNKLHGHRLGLWHAAGGLRGDGIRWAEQMLDSATVAADVDRATAIVLTTAMPMTHSVTLCLTSPGHYMVLDPMRDPAGDGPGRRNRATLQAAGMCEAIVRFVQGHAAEGHWAGHFEIVWSRQETLLADAKAASS
ncbi:hypothetical protein GT347_06255 [Xylophilus rhododendri]|uniref:Uncharacterized protein n=1 Tax=Xylophilus rhododendri TaxID=2697032 RepID=A0A857J152_9BURK|nr:hypothetical protein [Xylophilus rhododendri]QHI97624.1 hypothetical protein GT347_06255 [Xylophilus rhododendri]